MFRRHEKRRHGKTTLLITGILFTLLLVIGGFAARKIYNDNLKPVSTAETSKIITIASGATVQEIAGQLEREGVIREAWAFEWYVRNSNLRDQLKAGTYALKPSQSVKEVAEIITQGKVDTKLVTILPGKRLDQIKDKLINDGFDAKAVEEALNPGLYADHPALVDKPVDANLEGYLYPETFERTLQTQPQEIIQASLDQMQRYLTPDLRAGMVAQGLTVHQGVILASIIEREVPATNPVDRPQVAQVFLKRLREGILLQSDATASYGAVLDGVEPRLTYNSAYNTYINKGLPPSPISNVTATSLQAVANPAGTDYLYFVSGDDDINYFSKTLPEHEALVNQHCKRKCGR